jgi:hypothetical protein
MGAVPPLVRVWRSPSPLEVMLVVVLPTVSLVSWLSAFQLKVSRPGQSCCPCCPPYKQFTSQAAPRWELQAAPSS